ncbi:hypothetical protein HDU67_008006 [Dinochytrium kinnereticum]|nr:hypothetical protein HDU67_008006 [Dinochytrium kinnereticum]
MHSSVQGNGDGTAEQDGKRATPILSKDKGKGKAKEKEGIMTDMLWDDLTRLLSVADTKRNPLEVIGKGDFDSHIGMSNCNMLDLLHGDDENLLEAALNMDVDGNATPDLIKEHQTSPESTNPNGDFFSTFILDVENASQGTPNDVEAVNDFWFSQETPMADPVNILFDGVGTDSTLSLSETVLIDGIGNASESPLELPDSLALPDEIKMLVGSPDEVRSIMEQFGMTSFLRHEQMIGNIHMPCNPTTTQEVDQIFRFLHDEIDRLEAELDSQPETTGERVTLPPNPREWTRETKTLAENLKVDIFEECVRKIASEAPSRSHAIADEALHAIECRMEYLKIPESEKQAIEERMRKNSEEILQKYKEYRFNLHHSASLSSSGSPSH